MSNIGKKVKIQWNDAKLYTPSNKDISLTIMETVGLVEAENFEFLIIKNPLTKKILSGQSHPQNLPSYYYIPKGMIAQVEYLD